MSSIDERVVRMVFDNDKFETGVRVTLSTLSKLKAALDFKKDPLGQLQKSASSVNFDSMTTSLGQVQQGFTLLDRIAFNALNRIANKIIDTGATLARELTIQPVMSGFEEYGLNLDSTRTIMSGTGEALEVVTKNLNELNEYADKTIYSFSDMTSSIGKFTNAGIKLEPAVAAIKGVSNAAADAGADTQKASTAMYNISQSMSQGYLSLQDWRSVNNTASMGTKDFRQNLIETAVAMGTLRKEGDKYVSTTTNNQGKLSDAFDAFQGFDMSLQHQWATTEVMTEAFRHYAKSIEDMTDAERDAYEQSLKDVGFNDEQIKRIEELGTRANRAATEVRTVKAMWDSLTEGVGSSWAQSFQFIVGDLDEATALWTGVKDEIEGLIGPIGDARNEMLKFWHDNGGRTKLVTALSDAWQGVKAIMSAVSDAFKSVFPPMTGNTLMRITDAIADMATKFKDFATSSATLTTVRQIFTGLFNVFKMGAGVVKVLFDMLAPVAEIFIGFAKSLAGVAGDLGSFFTLMANAQDPLRYLTDALGGIGAGGEKLTTSLRGLVSAVETLLKKLLQLVGINIRSTPLSDLFDHLREFSTRVFSYPALENLKTFALNALSMLQNLVGFIIQIPGMIAGGVASIVDVFKGGGSGGGLSGAVIDFANSFKELNSATGLVEGFVHFIQSIANILLGVVSTVASYLPKMFEYLGSADFQSLANTFITLMTGGLINSIRKFVDIVSEDKKKAKKGGFWAFLDSLQEKLDSLVGTFTKTLETVSEALVAFTRSVHAGMLLKTAAAVGLLALSMSILAGLDSEGLSNAIVGIAVAMGVLIGGFKALDSGSGSIVPDGINNLSTSLIKMAIAVGILSIAVKSLSGLSMDELVVGLLGIAGAMGAMVAAVAGLARYGGAIKESTDGLLKFAVAIGIMGLVVAELSTLSWDQLTVGLSGVGLLLGELAAFSQWADTKSFTASSAASILVLAIALKVLQSSVRVFASMNWNELGAGLGSVGLLLAELAGFSLALSAIEKYNKIGVSSLAGIVVAVAAIRAIVPAVQSLASMGEQLSAGLGGMSVILIDLALFTAALGEMKPVNVSSLASIIVVTEVIKVLSDVMQQLGGMSGPGLAQGLIGLGTALIVLVGAVAVLGAASGEMIAGAAALAVAAGAMLIISAAVHVFASAMQVLAGLGLAGIIVGVLGLAAVTLVIVPLSAVLAAFSPIIVAAAVALGLFGTSSLIFGSGAMVAAMGLTALAGAFMALGAALPMLAPQIESFMVTVAKGAAKSMTSFLTTLFNGFSKVLAALDKAIHAAGDFLISNIPYFMFIGLQLITALLQTASEAIPQFVAVVGKLIIALCQALVTWIPTISQLLLTCVITLVNSVANGIRNNADAILAAVRNILSSIVELLLTALADIVSLIPGVGPMLADQIDGAKDVVRQTLAPESLKPIGENAVGGLMDGMLGQADQLGQSAKTVGESARDGLEDPLSDTESIGTGATDDLLSAFTGADGSFNAAGLGNMTSYLDGATMPGLGDLAGNSVITEQLGALGGSSDLFGAEGTGNLQAYLNQFGNTDSAGQSAGGLVDAQLDELGVSDAFAGVGTENNDAYSEAFSDTSSVESNASNLAQQGANAANQPAVWTNSANVDVQGFTSGIGAGNASSDGANLAGTGASGAASKVGSYGNAGVNSANAFKNKVNSSANSQGASLAGSGVSGARSKIGAFGTAGSDAAWGFANGVNSSSAVAAAARNAANIAAAAIQAMRAKLKEASPSKVTMEIGKYATEGFAIGMEKFIGLATKAGARLSDDTIDALSMAIEPINDYTNLDYDIDPTIRPVLDLTDIQNGVSKANELMGGLDGNVSIGLDGMSYANRLFGAMPPSASNPMRDFANTLAEQNAKNLSDVMQVYSNNDSSQMPGTLQVNVYGVSGPDEVADAVVRKVRLLALV